MVESHGGGSHTRRLSPSLFKGSHVALRTGALPRALPNPAFTRLRPPCSWNRRGFEPPCFEPPVALNPPVALTPPWL